MITKEQYEKIQELIQNLGGYTNTELETDDYDNAESLSYYVIDRYSEPIIMSWYSGFHSNEVCYYKFKHNTIYKVTTLEDELLRELDEEIIFLNQDWCHFVIQKMGEDETLGDYERDIKEKYLKEIHLE